MEIAIDSSLERRIELMARREKGIDFLIATISPP